MDIQVGGTYILKRGPDGEDCALPDSLFGQRVMIREVYEGGSVAFVTHESTPGQGLPWYANIDMLDPVRGPW